MASPKEVLMKAKGPVSNDSAIKELISRVFTTRNSLHFAHLASKSYSEHEALGYIYTAIVNKVDEIVECYQGKFGVLSGLSSNGASAPSDCCSLVKNEADWLCNNRDGISQGNDAIAALLDELEAAYLKTIYKLENLK